MAVLDDDDEVPQAIVRSQGRPPTSGDFGISAGTIAQMARIQETLSSGALRGIQDQQTQMIQQLVGRLPDWNAGISAQVQEMIRSLQPLFRSTLSKPKDFVSVDKTPTAYSSELKSASSYFERDEETITSFDELNAAITLVMKKNPNLNLVWRGAQDASWGFHSNLYRHLMGVNKVIPPEKNPRSTQNYPDEDQMVRAEKAILRIARDEWRLDGLPALEIFARLQHHGAPTRLIDVTRNPYIAAWFAVETSERFDELPARLFGVAMSPVFADGTADIPDTILRLDETGGSREPFWHSLETSELRQGADWGTGAKRRVWIPPAYDDRIVAQNAGFLLDGVPMVSKSIAPYFKKGTDSTYWKKADLLASASIYLKTAKPTRKTPTNAKNLAPTFTFRITAEAKQEIRTVLETRFSYKHATIYPDITGLADYVRSNLRTML